MTTTAFRRSALAVGAIAVTVAGLAGLASSALFTDTVASTGNSFAAGTVKLGAGAGATVFTLDNTQLAPGTVAYGRVTIANEGSLQLRYAMTSTPTGDASLGSRLQVKVVPTAAGATCDSAAVTAGTPIYNGALADAAFGSLAAGAQTGDRALSASASEGLCLQLSMPNGTSTQDNPFQGKSAGTAFTFTAEQTLNNA